MKVADLFVKLGIEGSEDAAKGVGKVDKGMQGLVSRSMAVKAGLLAIGYGLQRMMTSTAKTGTSLKQFESITGMSAQTLQKWQYAGKQIGIEANEIQSSFMGLQSALTEMATIGGLDNSLALISRYVDIDPSRLRETEYVLGQLAKFSQKAPADITRQLFGSLGISDGVLAGMREGLFDADKLAKAPALSKGTINSLNNINAAWAKLGHTINMSMAQFNAKHGGNLMRSISSMVPQILKLSDALATLVEKAKVFERIGQAIEGWSMIFRGAAKEAENLGKAMSGEQSLGETAKNSGVVGFFNGFADLVKNQVSPPSSVVLTPPATNPNRQGDSIVVNQSLAFQSDGSNAREVGSETRKAVEEAFRSTQRTRGN